MFILVRTQFASNLGSTVRVMKNMGFRRLILVRPECEVGIEARSFAMKGVEILDEARFLPDLESVAREIGVLVGTTGRFRGESRRLITCPELVEDLLPRLSNVQIGIVFGSEDNGLRREELRLCQWLVQIPTAPEYPVINLAQSAAIVAYHLHLGLSGARRRAPAAALSAEVDSLLARAEDLIGRLRLPAHVAPARLLGRLRGIAARAQLDRADVNLLHGLLKQMQRQLSHAGPSAAGDAAGRESSPPPPAGAGGVERPRRRERPGSGRDRRSGTEGQ
ncbi:MAG: RNA methyltransferase [Acidobacteriota bacterium]